MAKDFAGRIELDIRDSEPDWTPYLAPRARAGAPNVLLIPGTSSVAHLKENLAAADLQLPQDAMAALDSIATKEGAR